MPKYEYELLNDHGEVVKTFEVWQGINEPPLERDPETGAKVRRIISRTTVLRSVSSGNACPQPSGGHSCGGRCGCKH